MIHCILSCPTDLRSTFLDLRSHARHAVYLSLVWTTRRSVGRGLDFYFQIQPVRYLNDVVYQVDRATILFLINRCVLLSCIMVSINNLSVVQ